MKRILLIGKEGQIGWELHQHLRGQAAITAVDRSTFDLTDPLQMRKVIREIKPEVIINAAAYTAVDLAEKEEQLAIQINGEAPALLAQEANALGALLVHFSTDYVFDGQSKTPYTEESLTNPLNVYGRSKLQGELAVSSLCPKHLIFRTSWIYGMRGKNFLLTMLKLAKEKDHLKIVNDQIGSPTWSRSVALAAAGIILGDVDLDLAGLYHMTCQGQASWFQFASEIFSIYRGVETAKLSAIATEEYPTSAKRPLYSVLSCEKLKNKFCITLPHWKEALHKSIEGQMVREGL
jgi:dTDP-4-dehydrorhamnose reductase